MGKAKGAAAVDVEQCRNLSQGDRLFGVCNRLQNRQSAI
jgi:hypothetical protein